MEDKHVSEGDRKTNKLQEWKTLIDRRFKSQSADDTWNHSFFEGLSSPNKEENIICLFFTRPRTFFLFD